MRVLTTHNCPQCHVKVLIDDDDWHLVVSGRTYSDQEYIPYLTSAPPDTRFSYTGSVLPYANEEQALTQGGQAPNRYSYFQFQLTRPNAFYTQLGKVLNYPNLYLFIEGQKIAIPLPIAIYQDRSLTSLPGHLTRATGR